MTAFEDDDIVDRLTIVDVVGVINIVYVPVFWYLKKNLSVRINTI